MRIGQQDPTSADVRELAARHRTWASRHSPPEDVHAVEADGLAAPDLTLLSARAEDGALLGMGALRELDAHHGEVKAMHVVEQARGQGVGRALLEALLALARQRGYRRVSLETGSMQAFAAARSLYAGAGFTSCGPFGDYVPSPHSAFLSRDL